MLNRAVVFVLLTALLTGCSPKVAKVGTVAAISNGVRIELTASPDPPVAGDNTFVIRLADSTTGAPIVNANVTISAYNELAGGGDRESGRSQGDGSYNVPIKLGIPDTYKLNVQVQRPGHDDADTQFSITSG
jgi:hypothetical protein